MLHPELTEQQATAIQLRVAQERGGIAAWKVGLIGGKVQAAPIPRDAIHPSGYAYPPASFAMRGLETEIAFQLGRASHTFTDEVSDEEIGESIIDACYAIEILDSRLSNWQEAPLTAMLADGLSCGGLILGASITDWRNRDLAAPGVDLFVGKELAGRATRNPLGDPLILTATLIRHCLTHDIDIAEGSWITTGSSTGCVFTDEGVEATVCLSADVMVSVAFQA